MSEPPMDRILRIQYDHLESHSPSPVDDGVPMLFVDDCQVCFLLHLSIDREAQRQRVGYLRSVLRQIQRDAEIRIVRLSVEPDVNKDFNIFMDDMRLSEYIDEKLEATEDG